MTPQLYPQFFKSYPQNFWIKINLSTMIKSFPQKFVDVVDKFIGIRGRGCGEARRLKVRIEKQ